MPMSFGTQQHIRAGIELAGRTLRYAEVELGIAAGREAGIAPLPRLVRMGACDFDFNVEEAVLESEGGGHLDLVSRALTEILSGSDATQLSIAVHAWMSTSFFAPLPVKASAADKFEQLRQEAAMLADAPTPRPLHLTATALRTETRPDGRDYAWHHVLRVPEEAHGRAAHLAGRIGAKVIHRFIDATGAAAEVAGRLRARRNSTIEADEGESATFAVAVGLYDERIELSLIRGADWHFGQWVDAIDSHDAMYFCAALLERLAVEPSDVDELLVYGPSGRPPVVNGFEELLGVKSQPLNPLPLFRLARSTADPEALAAFAPCVGAAMR